MTLTALLHIVALTAQAFLLAAVTVWLFRWRSRLGLGFFIAAIASGGVAEIRFSDLVAPENAALIGNFGGTLLFSVKLFAVLLLYVREDAVEARSLLYGILGGSVVSLALIASAGLHLVISGGTFGVLMPVLKFACLHTFGMAILILDAILLILTYEWIMQRLRSPWLAAVGALILALSVDNIIFYFIYSRQDGFGLLLLQSFFGKWYAALVYGSCFAMTLRWVGFELGAGRARELSDVFETLTFRQRFEALRRRTDFDVLTGLRTRALLEQEAVEALADPASVLAVVDIDHFKRINDQHGHLRGDAVLRAVAQRILSVLIALPESTRAYRYGGEEFVVLGPLTATMLEQLRSAVADSNCDGLPVTISVGAARAHESNAGRRGLADIFSIADERLYRAKAEGRNRVVF